MLKSLELHGVGPSDDLSIEFAPRMNLITGDNGLGKSFLLDIAWWVLSRTWASMPARPNQGTKHASIRFSFDSVTKTNDYTSTFDVRSQIWTGKIGRPANPGFVIYARVDGGFSVWDPARNYWRTAPRSESIDRPSAYSFRPGQIWESDPLRHGDQIVCNGIVADWAGWQKEQGEWFELLKTALEVISPYREKWGPGDLTRIGIGDVRDIPTLRMPYQHDVPILYVSAGIKRMLALAYLLVWSWQEHRRASLLLDQPVTRQIVFLVDELEAHLHPQWQRTIMRSLLELFKKLSGGAGVEVQLIGVTHSPMILASVEPYFDANRDAIWEFDLTKDGVRLAQSPWRRRGEVGNWLTSSVFDLKEARSLEAEEAISQAADLLTSKGHPSKNDVRSVDQRLREVLGDIDPFWTRWSAFLDELGIRR
jgi:hypothetical protein